MSAREDGRSRRELPHAMGLDPAVKRALGRRLARIRGQVEGIGRMVEEERYCPDILQQLAAVRAAIRGAEKELLANHLERCASHALAEGGRAATEVRQELVEVFHRYLR